VADPVIALPAARLDPTLASACPSQLLLIERCDDRWNPPWLPRSEWWTSPRSGLRCQTAISSASTTSSARMWSSIAQPTQRRE
jgi:hypothetical protein